MFENIHWVTGNLNKVQNLNETLVQQGLPPLNHIEHDCREVLGSPVVVAIMKSMMAYKAVHESLPEKSTVMIEDTTLDLPGVHDWDPVLIKFNLERLPNYIGNEAIWTSHIVLCDGKGVYSAMASVTGRICKKVPGGFGFDPYFIPNGSEVTFGQDPAACYNPRFLALTALLTNKPMPFRNYDSSAEKNWKGLWQDV